MTPTRRRSSQRTPRRTRPTTRTKRTAALVRRNARCLPGNEKRTTKPLPSRQRKLPKWQYHLVPHHCPSSMMMNPSVVDFPNPNPIFRANGEETPRTPHCWPNCKPFPNSRGPPIDFPMTTMMMIMTMDLSHTTNQQPTTTICKKKQRHHNHRNRPTVVQSITTNNMAWTSWYRLTRKIRKSSASCPNLPCLRRLRQRRRQVVAGFRNQPLHCPIPSRGNEAVPPRMMICWQNYEPFRRNRPVPTGLPTKTTTTIMITTVGWIHNRRRRKRKPRCHPGNKRKPQRHLSL